MIDFIELMMEFLRVDVFKTFALLTLPLLILRNLPQTKERFIKWDNIVCTFIVFCGLLYTALLLVCWIYVLAFLGPEREEYAITHRATGPYAWAYFLMAFSWLVLTQPLRFSILRKNIGFRILLIPLFLFTYEQFVIIVTSYHRDYGPSSWTSNPFTDIFNAIGQIPYWPLHVLLKITLFTGYVFIFYWIHLKFKNRNVSKLVSSKLE